MKRLLMLVAVAAVAGAMYVTAAPGGRLTAGPTARQFAALKAQVTKLQKQVKTVRGDSDALAGIVLGCMLHQVVGVAQRGDPGGTFGYSYTNGVPSTSLTTALDLDSSAPTYTLLTLNPNPTLKCASLVGVAGLKRFHGLVRSAGR